ncbi:carbon-nitrogen hydrolase family protein [Catellatospora tritici]|uniref:carbon-nitrogen hydrolase family protein n=1 Tax=Catellatospora tritici TaxID=2851566 RepID=UPI001C2D6F1E|nr:carbon-nitrogen hydrolase family protein [Catellatospora tritici]MBV1849406.1 carbon-nitrogen hydrolase family protein [Catellatospora tritici]
MSLRVGACQTPELIGDIDAALTCLEGFAAAEQARDLDLLLFPEGFLQGYLVEPDHLNRCAMSLDSEAFAAVLRRLRPIRQTLVFGLIEADDTDLYVSQAVVTGGRLAGVYRKTHLTEGETYFTAGQEYPTFVCNGVRFGINICYDTRFPEAAAAVAGQGARLLLVPAQNMMRRPAALEWKHRHNEIRADRVRETHMWLVSADVCGERDESRVGWGPTCVMAPDARVLAQVPFGVSGMVTAVVR